MDLKGVEVERVGGTLNLLFVAHALRLMPDRVMEELRSGPWPEPYCGVCRALDKLTPEELQTEHLWMAANFILDYHDEPIRLQSHAKFRYYQPDSYYRCLAVYELARRLDDERIQDGPRPR